MKHRNFLVIFGLVCGMFLTSACSGEKFLWCTSNGIMTYNRHSGQFELLWESTAQPYKVVHDTVYVCPDSISKGIVK